MSTSDAVNGPQAYVFLPEQAAPPIPVAGTAGACSIYYPTGGTTAWISANGGAYVPIATGATSVTLNQAYIAGNTITVTDAIGAVGMNGTRVSGTVLSITNTATLTGALTGVSIDLSGSGSVGTPTTFDAVGVRITGAYSSVAKSTTSGLVYITSNYRSASAVRIAVKNKQSLAGSIFRVGWDSTNYEGGGNTTLDNQTHVVTIDASSYINDTAVEMIGLRILMAHTSNTVSKAIGIESGQTAGTILSVASATGTILSGTLYGITIDAVTGITPGAQTVFGINVLTPATTTSTSVGISNTSLMQTGTFYSAGFSGSTTLSNTITGLNIDLRTSCSPNSKATNGILITIPSGGAGDVAGTAAINIDSYSSTFKALGIRHSHATGQLSRWEYIASTSQTGTIYGLNLDFATLLTPGIDPIVPIVVSVGATTAADAGGAGAIIIQSQATLQRSLDIRVKNQGGTIQSISYLSATSLAATLTGVNVDLSTGVTPTTFAVVGAAYTIPASSSASTKGISITSTQKGGYGLYLVYSGTLSSQLTLIEAIISGTASSNIVIGLDMSLPGSTSSSTRAIKVTTSQRNGMMIDLVPNGISSLSGTITGLNMDWSSGFTPGASAVVGINLAIPASSNGSARGIALSSTQTGSGSSGITVAMSPGSSASVNGIAITMSANATGYALKTNHTGNAITVEFDSTHASSTTVYISKVVTGAANAGILLDVQLTGTWSAGGTDSAVAAEVLINRTVTASATWSGVGLYVTNNSISSGGATTLTMSGKLAYIFHSPGSASGGATTDTTTGLYVEMDPYTASSVVTGAHFLMSSNCAGPAVVVENNGSGAGVQFTVADGGAGHILGPAAGDLSIKAGTSAGAGRAVTLAGSAAAGSSGLAGGSINLNEGAGDGAGARGTIAIGSTTTAVLQFFATAGATQQTATGSRGGNAALASLLTALAAYGLVVDSTS